MRFLSFFGKKKQLLVYFLEHGGILKVRVQH